MAGLAGCIHVCELCLSTSDCNAKVLRAPIDIETRGSYTIRKAVAELSADGRYVNGSIRVASALLACAICASIVDFHNPQWVCVSVPHGEAAPIFHSHTAFMLWQKKKKKRCYIFASKYIVMTRSCLAACHRN